MKPIRFPIRAQILSLAVGVALISILSFVGLVVSLFSRDRLNLIMESQRAHLSVLSQEIESRLKFALLTSEGSRARFEMRSSDFSDTWTIQKLEIHDPKVQKSLIRSQLQETDWSLFIRSSATLVPFSLPEETPSLMLTLFTRAPKGIILTGALLDSAFFQSLLDRQSAFDTTLVDSNGLEILLEKHSPHPFQSWIQSQWNNESRELSAQVGPEKTLIALKRFQKLPFALISTVKEAPLERTFFELYWKSFLLGLFLILIFGALAFRFGSRITTPLKKLLESTRALARGEPIQTLYLNARHEIADLTVGFNAMAVELQNRKRSLERQNEELERRVLERTRELEYEKSRLNDAQEALLKSTRLASLGEMAGITAHEVLNPINNIQIRSESEHAITQEGIKPRIELLTTILSGWDSTYRASGSSQLLQELSTQTPEGRPLIEEDFENLLGTLKELENFTRTLESDHQQILSEIQRVTRLVNQMRGLARVSGDRKAIDVHLPLNESLISLKDAARKRGIRIIEDYGSDPRSSFVVSIDPSELLQVFSNLIRNSLHAVTEQHPTEGGWVRIRTRQTSEWVSVEIEDNGSGIDASAKERIFEPDYTTKGIEEGTGLGLSISRRIVRGFDGDLTLSSSERGRGTCFSIQLPHAKPEA